MTLLNFTHPLTPPQISAIEGLAGREVDRVIDVRTHFDHAKPFADQARALADSADLPAEEWQALPLLVNLPGHSAIAAALLAELHGRVGHFPAVLRLRPIAGAVAPQFEVAELIDLQAARDAARSRR